MLPHDFPPWAAVYQQSRRWLDAGVFDTLTDDLRALLRQLHGREPEPTAYALDSRTMQSTPESGARAGYDAGNLEPALASLPGRIDQSPAMLALFPHMQKRLTTERCKPLMYNEFLVGSAGFELAAPAV